MIESCDQLTPCTSRQSIISRIKLLWTQPSLYFGLVISLCLIIPLIGNIYLESDYPSFWVRAACYISSVCLCLFVFALSIKIKYFAYFAIPFIALIAFLSYYIKTTLGIYIDYQIIASMLETNIEESSALISFSSSIIFISFLLLLYGFIWFSYKRLHHYLTWKAVLITGGACALSRYMAFLIISTQYYPNTFPIRYSADWPIVDITMNSEHLMEYYTVERKQFQYLQDLPKPKLVNHPTPLSDDDECITIFHLGESVRQDHLQINGYPRETTPKLMTESDNIASFKDHYSYGVVTRVSVIGMLTNAEVKSRKPTSHSFVSAFKDAGYMTCCLKQTNPKSVYDSSMNILLADFCQHDNIYVDYNKAQKFDQSVERVKATLNEHAKEKKLFICLYDTGAHLPFVPFPQASHFTPDDYSQINPLSDIPKAINSYDNCIREIDAEIYEIISALKDKVALYIYVADHGVALGENNGFCGGAISPGTYQPAFFIWFSDKYKEKYPEIVQSIKQNTQKTVSHDYLYHTIPALCMLRTDQYQKDLDLTNPEAKSFDPPEDFQIMTKAINLDD